MARNSGILRLKGEATRTADGALLATTGNRTGRSPNDRFIVNEPGLASNVHWSKVNRPISPAVFDHLLKATQKHLNSATTLFVKDMHCGADPVHTMPVRLVSESAWHSAFMHNMFIRSRRDSPFDPCSRVHDTTCTYNDSGPERIWRQFRGFRCNFTIKGTRIDRRNKIRRRDKKSIFTIMNHILPSRGLLPMHCSANTSGDESALFFGLSGTGKTTLSADPGRELVGDDEHGWSDRGNIQFRGWLLR